jgi:hypothetical protein
VWGRLCDLCESCGLGMKKKTTKKRAFDQIGRFNLGFLLLLHKYIGAANFPLIFYNTTLILFFSSIFYFTLMGGGVWVGGGLMRKMKLVLEEVTIMPHENLFPLIFLSRHWVFTCF